MLLFLKIMLTEFIAEMGDKTQLMLVGMTSRYKLRDIVFGTAAAILVLNGIAVLAGGLVSAIIPDWLIKLIAALAFLYFALTSIGDDDDDEEEGGKKGVLAFAPVAVFLTFFVAELGDKTQLTAITFGANEGLQNAFIVWIACSIGLFAADILGMMLGFMLKNNTSDTALKVIAFVIFTIFGILTFRKGLIMIVGYSNKFVSMATIGVGIIFAVLCVFRLVKAALKANINEEE